MKLEQLSQWEQGLLWAALVHADQAPNALARLAEPDQARCEQSWQAAKTLSPEARRRLLAELGQRIFSPLPAGLSRVHPSWIDHLLESLPPAWQQLVRQSVLSSGAMAAEAADHAGAMLPAVRTFLLRQAFAPLVPMPRGNSANASTPAAKAAALSNWPTERLHPAILHFGLLLLAAAAHQAGSQLQETLSSRLEPVLRAKLQQALAQDLPLVRVGVPGADLWGLPQPQMFFVLGARALGPALGHPLRQQVAQRLPRPLGLELLVATAAPLSLEPALRLLSRADSWARGGAL